MTDKPLNPIIIIDEAAKIDPAVLKSITGYIGSGGVIAIDADDARLRVLNSHAKSWVNPAADPYSPINFTKRTEYSSHDGEHEIPRPSMADAQRAIFDARVHENPDRIIP